MLQNFNYPKTAHITPLLISPHWLLVQNIEACIQNNHGLGILLQIYIPSRSLRSVIEL